MNLIQFFMSMILVLGFASSAFAQDLGEYNQADPNVAPPTASKQTTEAAANAIGHGGGSDTCKCAELKMPHLIRANTNPTSGGSAGGTGTETQGQQ